MATQWAGFMRTMVPLIHTLQRFLVFVQISLDEKVRNDLPSFLLNGGETDLCGEFSCKAFSPVSPVFIKLFEAILRYEQQKYF